MTTVDPNSPMTEELDTTIGGGNPGFEGQAYVSAPHPAGIPVAGTVETDDISGGTVNTGIGDTGDSDDHSTDPEPIGDTTVPGGGWPATATGDTDDHSNDPSTVPPDTTIGGGGIGVTADPDYVVPADFVPASIKDTSGRGGFLNVNPGSPDDQAVGDDSGLNPNAVEPAIITEDGDTGYPAPNSSYDVGGTLDTTNAGAPAFSPVPAASGTPNAPTAVSAAQVSGRSAVTVTWTAPNNAVATKVTQYVVESSTGGTMRVGKDAPLEAEFEQGLTPGQAYTFTVYALTANGSGTRSAASAPVTIAMYESLLPDTEPDEGLQGPESDVPGASVAPVATHQTNGTISVAFVAPVDDNGSPVTEYTVVSTPGNIEAVGTASPLVVSGLAAGTSYTFKVKSRNVYGYGALSPASNAVVASTVPGAPTAVAATSGDDAQSSVSFTAPASTGGSAITGYTATSTPGDFTASGASSPLVVSGLANGTAYTFTVHATNANGNSAESVASAAATPATVPGAPTIGTATVVDADSVSVAFTPPVSNGGSAITGYTATSTPSGITASGASSPIQVDGLAAVEYTFTVHATNAEGNSAESAASNAVTPA